ncbi:right-handed parallel beta-helix repeat-containing protein [Membranihabitans marinus]|uniref:right-handed parallel beta-helix repeat-containing protein n=1 Tax=Membranihabitans marinus TaxID=1227546 RepID=UPI001F490ED4|nr:right-handed parallel beta-helix repeat-containing protein [Membranihabitans marinus]
MTYIKILILAICVSCYTPLTVVDDSYNKDTATLYQMIHQAKNNKVMIMPKADRQPYRINQRLPLPSNTVIELSPAIVIQSIDDIGGIFLFDDIENTIIKGNGAKLIQRRDSQRSMIYLLGGRKCIIQDLILDGTGKDGIYIGTGTTTGTGQDHVIQGCKISNMKRQGISVVDAIGTQIIDCHIDNTHGAPPAAGIDLEENENTTVENTIIKNCRFTNHTEQAGIVIAKANKSLISSCNFTKNKMGINIDLAGTGTSKVSITSVDLKTNQIHAPNHGLKVHDLVMLRALRKTEEKMVNNHRYTFRVYEVVDKDHITLSYNYGANPVTLLSASKDYYLRKYELSEIEGTTIDNCTFIDNGASIYAEQAKNVTVKNCKIEGGYGGINLVNTANAVIQHNTLRNNTGGRAIFITAEKALITDNYIENAQEEGIEIQGTECTQISRNLLKNCGRKSDMAIMLKYTKNSIISNNNLIEEKKLRYGLVLIESVNNQITDNLMPTNAYNENYAGSIKDNIQLRSKNQIKDPCP